MLSIYNGMTIKEKDKLVDLITSIHDFTRILHPPTSDLLLHQIQKATDDQVLDILIQHFEMLRIYQIYSQFDREAGMRDIENLLGIINNINSKESKDGD